MSISQCLMSSLSQSGTTAVPTVSSSNQDFESLLMRHLLMCWNKHIGFILRQSLVNPFNPAGLHLGERQEPQTGGPQFPPCPSSHTITGYCCDSVMSHAMCSTVTE